jgi:hypothetical protein
LLRIKLGFSVVLLFFSSSANAKCRFTSSVALNNIVQISRPFLMSMSINAQGNANDISFQTTSSDSKFDFTGAWNALVQTLILIVIFLYTLSTRKMQVAMVRQIKLSVLPSFTMDLVQQNTRDPILGISTYALTITNIGSGTALNIEVQPISLHRLRDDRRTVGAPNLKFKRLGILRRDETSVLEHESFSGTERLQDDYMIDFEEQHIGRDSKTTEVIIEFQDIEGDNHCQRIRIGSNGFQPSAVKP